MQKFSYPQTISELLAELRNAPSHRILLKYMEDTEVRELTSGQFFQFVDNCTAGLKQHIHCGEKVGIMGMNRPQWLVHLCAVFQLGAVPVLLAPDLNAEDFLSRIKQCSVTTVLQDAALASIQSNAVNECSVNIISMDQEYAAAACPAAIPALSPEDLGCIIFTSGTTAVSKAVMLSQKALCAGACHNLMDAAFRSQLAILPVHHLAGFGTVLNSWFLGAEICLGTDYKYLFRYLSQMKPDYIYLVPSMLQALLRKLQKGGKNGRDIGWDLHYICCGAAQFPPNVVGPLNAQNIHIFQGYGATEMGSIGFIHEMTPTQDPSCIGVPPEDLQIRLENRELFVRSDSIMSGYLNDSEATAQVLQDGWYRTGDLARINDDGSITLTGRCKNVIILSNGENVSPEEIEQKLLFFPSIEEVIVGSQQDRIAAWIYPSTPDEQTKERIQQDITCYNHQAPTYKQIHLIHYLDAPIPKNQAGKPIRRHITGEERL